ncbi:MAG TPA: PAS domain S-box protein [Terriglobales bacterium]|nr:PAS domain S-box protein [Terriglobales bacterium]
MERGRLDVLTYSVGATLTQSLSLRDKLQRCVETLVCHFGHSCARIWTFNSRENFLELKAHAGVCASEDGADNRIPVGPFCVGLITRDQQPLLSDAIVGDARIPEQEWAKQEGMVAFAGYPLVVGDRLLGVLGIFTGQPIAGPAVQALALIASMISLGIEGSLAADSLRALEHRQRVAEDVLRLASIVESSGDAILSYTLDGAIASWNAGAEKLYGYTAEEIKGKPGSVLLPPGHEDEVRGILERAKREGGMNQYDTARLRKDGTQVAVSLTVSPIRDADGRTIGASTIARDITERRKTEKALRELSGRLLELQDKERARIARELHESTAQNLVALEITLSMVREAAAGLEPKALQALGNSIALVRECLQETRTLSCLLHPLLLDEMGLASALRAYADGYTRHTDVDVVLDIPADLGRLPQEVEIALFRVVQEALANVHHHSGSPRATIQAVLSRDGIVLEVKDEGRGIPADVLRKTADSTAKFGMGIWGMRERLRQLGGLLEIHSDSQGTTVRASLPLHRGET